MLQTIAPNTMLSTIIRSYPEAALKKNRRGRLPLHEASDNKWFDYEDIERLAKADPEALDVPDPVTGLYPFMMAASHPPVHKTGYDDVTKIFILLRESPENARRFDNKTNGGKPVENRKVAKPGERVANGRYAPATKQGNRKRSSSSKKRFVDDDFLSGSSEDEDGDYNMYDARQPTKRSSAGGMGEDLPQTRSRVLHLLLRQFRAKALVHRTSRQGEVPRRKMVERSILHSLGTTTKMISWMIETSCFELFARELDELFRIRWRPT